MSPHALILALALSLPQNQARRPAEVARVTPPAASKPASAQPALPKGTPLAFKEFFEPGARELKPSSKLLALNGRRVTLVGFMAQMEEPIKGGFYLCPRPVFCDEGGGGTGDLPPETVRVIVRSAKGRQLAHRPQALEVTGLLDIGAKTEEDGQVSLIRLTLDRPADAPKPAPEKRGSSPTAVKTHAVRKTSKKNQ